jgi:hypothetical protein
MIKRPYRVRHDSPITPLPVEQAEAILNRMFRDVDWASLFPDECSESELLQKTEDNNIVEAH